MDKNNSAKTDNRKNQKDDQYSSGSSVTSGDQTTGKPYTGKTVPGAVPEVTDQQEGGIISGGQDSAEDSQPRDM